MAGVHNGLKTGGRLAPGAWPFSVWRDRTQASPRVDRLKMRANRAGFKVNFDFHIASPNPGSQVCLGVVRPWIRTTAIGGAPKALVAGPLGLARIVGRSEFDFAQHVGLRKQTL